MSWIFYTSILLSSFFILQCESIDVIDSGEYKNKTNNRLEELSKAALSVKVYSIIEADPQSGRAQPTYLPNTKLILMNKETKEKRTCHLSKNGINLFLDLDPGTYLLYQLLYDDPLSFPLLNILFPKIDDKVLVLLDGQKLTIEVEPQKLQYGGDFSIMMTKKGIKTSPAEFENEDKDMRKTADLIMSNFPHSRWTVPSMKILKTTGQF